LLLSRVHGTRAVQRAQVPASAKFGQRVSQISFVVVGVRRDSLCRAYYVLTGGTDRRVGCLLSH
jgi:hypothetical protein